MASLDHRRLSHTQSQQLALKRCLHNIQNMTNTQFNYRFHKFSKVYSKWLPPLSITLFAKLIFEFNRANSEYHGSTVIDLLTQPFLAQPDINPFMYRGVTELWNDLIFDKYEELQQKGANLTEVETDNKNWLLWYFIKRW